MSKKLLKKERDPSILILDFGSQYSELIEEE
jgi:GMP synthase (glutamine-hydrolysing)